MRVLLNKVLLKINRVSLPVLFFLSLQPRPSFSLSNKDDSYDEGRPGGIDGKESHGMADLFGSGNFDRDDKVLLALKKGSRLLKYGRKGNPKSYRFRISPDESSLIWLSKRKEKRLKLASVSKIISGQTTAAFQRFLCPERNYESFSLIYNNGNRSLDLICKDKAEVEVWFGGLSVLIASYQSGRSKIDGWNDGGISLDDSRDLSSNRLSDTSESTAITSNLSSSSLEKFPSFERTDATKMQVKSVSSDVYRVSVSSIPSTTSHGSAFDDPDNLGDVYVWGEVTCDISTRADTEDCDIPFIGRADILLPRALESNIIFDAQYVACGARHAALVTRQGELFTWGEESGGRLGHGVGTDMIQPHLVESLSLSNIDYVACGEFHTCAITKYGELYTWGDGTHNAGLLGHGSNVSHWVPKRVSGPLEGLEVSYVACGTWHTALITSNGQLFTFGDGTFGVLGHGNRESVSYPREVESLMGLKTILVSCGVWHTAAIVEVIVTQSNSNASSGKLFTWGDGDKYRLGHGDKEPRLKPTCVPSLIDHNFHKLSCGHSLTVGLTTSKRVFTMGSNVYGQLGNPLSDWKLPCLVEDKLANELVEEITCGSYHVAVLTAKNEVYTWGKGANGRLGHGDIEDRKTPNLVEAVKDRHVKQITCGSNFSAAICHHKWVSGAEHSQCSSCRQTFGFTRKKHNCYNCGLVHCHYCSSRKALRAALSPNPAKPYRVCDSCYQKLSKPLEYSLVINKRINVPRLSAESKDKFELVNLEIKSSKVAVPSNMDLIKQLDTKASKYGAKTESLSLVRGTHIPLTNVAFPSAVDLHHSIGKTAYKSTTPSVSNSRVVPPFSRKSSPPRSATPIPISSSSSSLPLSKYIDDNLKKRNRLLNEEVQKLRAQVECLKQCFEIREFELKNSAKKTEEALALAAEESARSSAAKEVIKSLTVQLKDAAEMLPNGVYGSDDTQSISLPNGIQAHARDINSNGQAISQNNTSNDSCIPLINGVPNQNYTPRDKIIPIESSLPLENQRINNTYGGENEDLMHWDTNEEAFSSRTQSSGGKEHGTSQSENILNDRSAMLAGSDQVEAEWIEQYEPGVYISLISLRDDAKDLKRVRFSRRRFKDDQAKSWWLSNREKVYEKYNLHPSNQSSSSAATTTQPARRSKEEKLPSPHPRWHQT